MRTTDFARAFLTLYDEMLAAHDAIDDAFCAALYENYQNDPDKGDFVSIEEAAAALGVEL